MTTVAEETKTAPKAGTTEIFNEDGLVRQALEQFETFEDAGLPDKLLASIKDIGWKAPTPVQSLCLPYTLKGKDVAGFAQTGTGKTGVFLITISTQVLNRKEGDEEKKGKGPYGFVIVPTRELAMQIDSDAASFFKALGLKSLAVFGGVDYEKQGRALSGDIDVIVGTPGRVKDFIMKKKLSLADCSLFVCDEADRMFDMGFIEDIEFFLQKLPEGCQKLLFSATTNENVKELAFKYLDKPHYITVTPESITPETIDQHAVICEAKYKLPVMLGLLKDHNPSCSIIFTNTKLTASWLHHKLIGNDMPSDVITGDLPQRKRMALIDKIKNGQIKALIATDVASRGLHIAGVTHVYNFDLPDEPQAYVHRVGRTARAGAKGHAYSLVCEDYGDNLAVINELLGTEAAMNAEWFPEKYLAIEDKAGNPFEKMAQEAKERKERSGATGKTGRPARNKSAGKSDRKESTTRRPKKSSGKKREGNRQERSGGSQKKRREHRNKNNLPPTKKRKRTVEQTPAAAAQNQSVGGLVKKIFSTLFGKKS